MAELSGLRPLKETNTLGTSPVHNQTMNGAYDIYVQDTYGGASANQNYYASKWLRLPAGTYQIRFIFDDIGEFSIDGNVVASGSNGGTWETPVVDVFTMQANSVVRFDLHWKNTPAGASYACYELTKDGVVIEVSRANEFIGDTIPIPLAALGPKPPYSQDIRLTYPVFLVKPDWRDGVIERLEWRTDVLTSESGAEQRRKLRQFPRRSIEAAFSTFGNNRNLIDSYVAGVGAARGLVPLWFDETSITSRAFAGSVDIFGDIEARDYNVNDVVLIRRDGAMDYELNIVAELRPGQLVLATGLQQDTAAKSTITPVRVGMLLDQVTGSMLTDRVQQYALRFYTEEVAAVTAQWNLPFYTRTNIPILTLAPNYKETVSLSFDRMLYTWDNQIGNVYTADPGNQVSTGQKFSYHVTGRKAMLEFKQMLYRMSGKWREFHVPTGHDDIPLARDVAAASGALISYRNGVSQYLRNNQNARRDILIHMYDGTIIPNTIISSRVVGDEEWLFLAETIAAIPKDQVRRISYMPRSRLDIDAIEINRLTDADGTSTISLTFKSMDERRVAPPANF